MSGKIHPSAIIDKTVKLKADVVVGPNCVIDEGVVIGEGTVFDANVAIGRNVTIGQRNQFPTTRINTVRRNATFSRFISSIIGCINKMPSRLHDGRVW